MRADEVLVAHHEVLRHLLGDLLAAPADRLRDELLRELEVHTQIEDELFYPALRDVSPLLSLAHAEHRQIDDQLAVVMRTALDDPGFPDEVRMLAATLQHHMFEEEQRMFPHSRALGDERLEQLGDQLQQRQHELRTRRRARWMVRVKRETLRHL